MGARRLVLHIGMGKTGSSALQAALVRNRELLAAAGVHYPRHASDPIVLRGGASIGNGEALLPCLAPLAGQTEEQAAAALDRLCGVLREAEADTVVYSSEMLFYFTPELLTTVRDRIAALGVRLDLVLYVRDYAPLIASSYAERVKRDRYTGTLDDYVQEYVLMPPLGRASDRLRHIEEVLGEGHVTVLHFDTERGRLVAGFFEDVLGIHDLSGYDLEVPSTINRSLTSREIEWMRLMNAQLSSPVAALFAGDHMIAVPPAGAGAPRLTDKHLVDVRAAFQDEADWINGRYFPEPRLGMGRASEPTAVPEIGEWERHLVDVMVTMAERLASYRLDERRRRRRLSERRAEQQRLEDSNTGAALWDWRRVKAGIRRRLQR